MINTSKLRELRKTKSLTQEEIADLLCISQSTYARIESGNSKSGFNYLEKISVLLKVLPTELLSNIQNIEDEPLFKQLKEKDDIIDLLQNRIKNLEMTLELMQKVEKLIN